MTRKKSLSTGLFGMPQALTEAALEQLTPAQCEAIRSDQAGEIMRLMVDTAEKVGRIIERPAASANQDKQPSRPINEGVSAGVGKEPTRG